MTGRSVHALDPYGTICDWLVSPVWTEPCDDLDAMLVADGSPWGEDGRWVLTNGPDVAPLKQRLYARRPLRTDEPLPEVVEGGTWRRVHTGADGLVDYSAFCFTPEYRQALAATVLEVDQAEWRTLRVASTGPVAVWLGGKLARVFDEFSYMEPIEHELRVRLASGTTELVLATWQVAFRECRHVARVRIDGLPVRVVIPSPGADEFACAVAEQVLDAVAVQSWAVADGIARLTGPAGAALRVNDRPVVLVDGTAEFPLTGERESGDTASMLGAGESTLTVRVDDPRCPVTRTLRVALLPSKHRQHPVGEPAQWRRELLDHVASATPSCARALARHAVRDNDLAPALDMLASRADCADFEAVGLLHVWHRVPEWPDGLRDRVRDALVGFKYWIDQPGLDAMCYFTENHQIVWHTAELLAGEAFRDTVFGNTGWTGARHAEHAQRQATAWLRRRLMKWEGEVGGGFSEFDSNAYLAIDALALVSIVEFAESTELRRLAEALLDKVLLTLAANSWRGVHGAAHGRSYTPTLRSSRFEETAPIMWLLWGVGALNAVVLPATVLATARRYTMPAVVRAIAHAEPEVWEGRQVYRGTYRFEHDLLSRPYGSDLRIYRTPDAMLASVQDYRYGLPGLQEHVWGATLGPELQVFATQPAASDHSSAARPNAWAGHRVLPRVRQHRDTVLALHRVAADSPLGTTHLWLPAPLFDEWTTAGPWLAARAGDGYVAVATAGGFRPVTTGDEAFQNWLPRGDGRAYVATIGRRATGGDFADFVATLGEPAFDSGISWRAMALEWTGPFTVDGVPVDLGPDGRPEDPPHLANPAGTTRFGAHTLEAAYGGQKLVLDLVAGARVEPASGVRDGR